MKMGLLTSAGMLIPKRGLSARWRDPNAVIPFDNPQSPPTTPWAENIPIPPVKVPVASLTPTPTQNPNNAAGEGRTHPHQSWNQFNPLNGNGDLYEVHQQAANVNMHPDLPLQPIWGFDGITPGPTYISHYGRPALVRNFNDLPDNNGGFGLNEVSTHLHNGHTPSESDGNPCDFFPNTQWPNSTFYDQHYLNVLAGFDSSHPPNGDIREALSTLWYHDHRIDFTSQNVYKGLVGFYLLYNEFDTGNEMTGFRLPAVPNPTKIIPDFDVPMMFTDKVFDEDTGILAFDLANLDGILGDKFLVNGKIQPVLHVHPRRYRFRWLNSGPARFYQFFFTDLTNLNRVINFHQIANDGNLLPKPQQVTSARISVAERMDVIVDFTNMAGQTIYIENRLEQKNGRGPTDKILNAGQGNLVLQIKVDLPPVADNSVNPASTPTPQYYQLPPKNLTPRITRTFRFERQNGQWAINQKFADCNDTRFAVQRNSVEKWVLQNNSGGWQHPIHIHFEEFQILNRNGVAPGVNSVENARKDVLRLGHNEQVELFFRFRDFLGRYPMHCHNVIHEDHAMMLLFEMALTGDNKTNP
jgi:FtsP/CotA-like multicopper oxidase with cupredoxin domain